MERLDILICIVTHNSRDDLAVCLTRLHEVMPAGLSIQTVVVDNTGADGSSDYVRENWSSVRVITNDTPQGFGANINQAVGGSAARYLLVMNPDVTLSAGAIETMVDYLEGHAEVGLCGPKTFYPDGRLQATCRRFPSWGTVFWRWLKLEQLAQPEFYRQSLMLDWDHNQTQAVDWVMGSCMMLRAEAFQAIGGMDESYFLYYEDIDLCRRLWQAGYPVHYMPEAIVTHAYQRKSGSDLLNKLTLTHLKSILNYRRRHGLTIGQIVGKYSIISLIVLLIAGDLVITELALQLGRYSRLWFPLFGAFPYPNPSPLNQLVYLIVPVIWLSIFSVIGLYRPDRVRQLIQEIGRLLFGVMLSGLVLAGSLYALFLYNVYIPRLLLAYFLLFDALLLIGWRVLFQRLLSRNGLIYRPRTLILGRAALGQDLAEQIQTDKHAPIDLIGTIPWWPDEAATDSRLQTSRIIETLKQLQIDEVILTPPLPSKTIIADIVKALHQYPVEIKIVPDFIDLALHQVRIESLYNTSAISLRSSAIHGEKRVIKRIFDLVIAFPLFLLFLPIMFIVAIAVRLDSPGPIIFRQRRVGENGRTFWIYKFRSMIYDAEQRFPEVVAVNDQGYWLHKTPQDPRLTRVGRFLRRWSLDELPQLWNVITGKMSLVGPRPELPNLVERYEAWQYRRFVVPPGITGWWQIRGRSQRPMHLATEEDLFYIEHFSIWLDLGILVRTIWAVVSGRGAF